MIGLDKKDMLELGAEILRTSPENVVAKLKQFNLKPNEGIKSLFYLLRVGQRSDATNNSKFVCCFEKRCFYSDLEKNENKHTFVNLEYGNFYDWIANKGETDILVIGYEFTKI